MKERHIPGKREKENDHFDKIMESHHCTRRGGNYAAQRLRRIDRRTERSKRHLCRTGVDLVEIMELTEGEIPLADAPKSSMLLPQASGTEVQSNAKAAIDYSNIADGYVMVKYTAATSQKLKVIVKGPKTTYTYNLAADKAWDTYPLSDGSGAYTIGVYENVSGTKYAGVLSQSISVTRKDEFAPFVRPNQYVDYENAPKTVAKAAELVSGKTKELDKVQAVYDFVIKNIKYDKQLAATVKSGYLPVLDTVLEKKTGICFDYAVYIGDFDADSAQTEGDTLILREEAGENVYLTRIYCADGSLRELFGTADGGMQPEDGEIILTAESVHSTQNGRRITADITNADGETISLMLTLRSGEEAAA